MANLRLPQFKSNRLKELFKKIVQDPQEKALQNLLALEAEHPDDLRIRQQTAELYYKRGHLEEALSKFWEIAESYEKQDFVLKAIDTYKNILKIKPDMVEINLRLTSLYLKVDMKTEAANQFRIAINYYARAGFANKTLALAQQLVELDPSPENRAKLAEIYQSGGMTDEAVKQYELLAKDFRARKNYDKLLHFYELILPHRPNNTAIVKDLCILYLRKKDPQRTLTLIDQHKVGNDPAFEDLAQKARLMMEAIKRQKK
jgi:tetratricopeptide (TPR) repeat protein